jgi:hypothetical protein
MRLGEKPTRLDLRKHPRIVKQEVQRISRQKAPKREEKKPLSKVLTPPVKPLRKIHSIAHWERLQERGGPSVQTKIGAGVDTGRKKKRR